MRIDRNMQVGIISSVVASIIFLYVLEPALRFITFLLTHAFGAIFRSYLDRLFEKAALLSAPDSSATLLTMSLALLCGFFVGLSASIVRESFRGADEIERAGRLRFSRFWMCTTIIAANIVLASMFIMVIHSTVFQLRITSSFQQHLTAIAPYVSDQEFKTFRSRWTQMTCERDYSLIYADLARVAATNSVRLPANKLYSLSVF